MLKTTANRSVHLQIDEITLEGILHVPINAIGLVIFAHGSGSSRHSPRNAQVARVLHEHNLATLLFDLLTPEEDLIYENRFDIDLMAERLQAATNWVLAQTKGQNLPIGYFGASTGSAVALKAAVAFDSEIKAIVSRGGRPDLALPYLKFIKSPTLLIVGGDDLEVLRLNEQAYFQLQGMKELRIIPGASHLFEEPGALSQVAVWSAEWFEQFLCPEKVK